MNDEQDEDQQLSPAEMMALLKEQQRRVDLESRAPIPWLYGIWGVAWIVGYLFLWSAWPDGNPWFTVPGVVAAIVFATLTIAAIVSSAVLGVRINRGVRGMSDFQGAVYGISWSVTSAAFALVGMGLIANGLSSELTSIYFPSAYALLVGTQYLAGAALWRDKLQLVLGIVLLAVGSVSPFFGQPTNNLVVAIAGGGAFIVAAAIAASNRRRGD